MRKVYSELYYHLTWHTKEDKPYIDAEVERFLFSCIGQKCKQEGYRLLAINGIENHIHVLLLLQPAQAVWETVNLLKGSSSHDVNKHFDGKKKLYWQNGYGVFTFRKQDLPALTKYVNEQKQHHHNGTTQKDFEIPEIQ
jgi:putative transposase